MRKWSRRILALCLAGVLALSCTGPVFAEDMPPMEMPGGIPGGSGGAATAAETFRCQEGPWSFVLTVEGDTRTSTITGWDKAQGGEIVIVPAYLGGGRVTAISSTAFSAASSVKALYLPDTVKTIAAFVFYDLNSLQYISCGNPNVVIDGQTLASCNSQEIQTTGTPVWVNIENSPAAAVAGGSYLVGDNAYAITQADIAAISAGDYSITSSAIVFTGDAYKPQSTEKPVKIARSLKEEVQENDFRYTFRNLTDEAEAEAFQAEIAAGAYGTVQLGLDYSPGYYLNGSRVQLDPDCRAIDAATGEALAGIVSTGMTYTYVAYRDTDQNGAIDILYYTDGVSDFVSAPLDQNAEIYAPGTLSDGKDSASSITGKYLAFANGVLEAAGRRDRQTYDRIVIGNTGRATYAADGKVAVSDPVLASINRERSLLWADDYGSIQTDYLYGMSSSTANWAQETFEAGDSKYNYELNMNYGLNAGLYATNGGQLTVGDLEGQTSYVETCGDTGNGIIAIGGGTYVGNRNAPYPTAAVYVYNTTFKCQGWNSHVADAIYGGHIYLEKVTGTTGMPGSYLGQSSALANDFGAGTLEAVDCDFTTYGNGSAGAYVIGQGSGTIKAINTNFTSYLDSGLCSAGGEFDINGGSVKGIIGFRARANGADSALTSVALTKADVNTNYADYVTDLEDGIATEAAKAWAEATGDSGMPGPACSNLLVGVKGTTLGDLCDAYQVSRKARETLYNTLSELSGEEYSDGTSWRCSLLDSDRYGHPVADTGKLITAGTDYSEAPYLNNGVGAERLQTSAVIEFQNAQLGLTLNDCTVSYEGDGNYNYLIASESKGCAQVTFNDCKNLTGIIWNEGDKASSDSGGINLGNSDMGGFVGSGSSYGVIVDFHGSSFAGNFADGDYGLWNVEGLRYTNGAGETSSLNGNYYGASANWGNCASFDGSSSWTVTGDSYLGSLTLEQGFTLSSEPGMSLEIYVGVDDSFNVATGTRVSSLEPGTYENVVILVK